MKISINSLVGLGTNFQQTMFYKQLWTFHLMFTPPLRMSFSEGMTQKSFLRG
jgi:hypothetical protein